MNIHKVITHYHDAQLQFQAAFGTEQEEYWRGRVDALYALISEYRQGVKDAPERPQKNREVTA